MFKDYIQFSRTETREIFVAIRAGDEDAREDFIVNNLPLVLHIAKKLAHLKPAYIDFSDIVNSGNLGLIKAVDKYNPDKGSFSTYAFYWIQAEIRAFLNQTHSGPTIQFEMSNAIRKLNRAYIILTQKLGYQPSYQEVISDKSVQEIAESISKTPTELLQAARDLSEPFSLDQSVDVSGIETPYLDLIPDKVESPDINLERRDLITHLLAPLSKEEKLIICHYFGINGHEQLNTRELGEKLGQTQQSISLKKGKIISYLKKRAETDLDVQIFRGLV